MHTELYFLMKTLVSFAFSVCVGGEEGGGGVGIGMENVISEEKKEKLKKKKERNMKCF